MDLLEMWARNKMIFDKKYFQLKMDEKRFGGMKIKVLERDKYSCSKCGMTDEQHIKKYRRRITVDHVDGDRENNSMCNLMTLCLSCHGKKDGKKAKILPKLICKNGHYFTMENTYIRPDTKHKQCRICRRIQFNRFMTKTTK